MRIDWRNTNKEFTESYDLLQAALEPLQVLRDELDITLPNGTAKAMSIADVARQWDAATVAERRAMLVDAIGPTDQMRVFPFTGKRGTFDPLRIVVVEKWAPLVCASAA